MPALQLALLGPSQVYLAGALVTQFPTAKVQALLAYLAVEAHTAHARDTLMGLFWPDYTAESARQNLRQALFRLRQTIPPAYFLATTQSVQFNPTSDYHLDVTTFTDLITTCQRHAHADLTTCAACMERLQQAVDLYRGDFLAGFFLDDSPAFEEWILLRREWLRRETLQALHHLATYHEQQGEYEQAYRYAWRQVELDSMHEEAHRQLMRALALSSRRSEALAQYLTCCRLLADELGVEPSPETTALYEQIRAGTFDKMTGRQGDKVHVPENRPVTLSPPHPVTPSPQHNLPGQLTSFIGRTRELEEVKMLLAPTALGVSSQGVRLLTLTGAGGCGKTRLALQIAAELVEQYHDGVWFVDLAPLADATLVPHALLTALGVREQPGRPLPDTLADFLRPKQLLLVLDNCEHLVATCAHLVEALLAAAPRLQVLATSREVLAVAGERAWRVPGLARRQLGPLPPLEQLAQFDAIRLFVARAITAAATFHMTDSNAPAVAQICRCLDGLPLAIELAAARVKVLSVEQIAERLNNRFRLLTTNSRTAPARHQTLRAALDWSYSLLSEAEQTLLHRLSVFAGGWTLEAAESVCANFGVQHMGHSLRTEDVLDVLARLVDKSLVVVDQAPVGSVRYRLLETIRQYAAERLHESGEALAIQTRHAHFLLVLAETAEPALHSPQQLQWFARLKAELDNLRAALAWSQVEVERGELGLRLAGALWWFWDKRASEGRAWLEHAFVQTAALGCTPLRAKALREVGHLAQSMGDYATAQAKLEESIAMWRTLGDSRGLAYACIWLIDVMIDRGDFAQAQALAEEGLALCEQVGDKWGMAWALNYLATPALNQGDYAAARTIFERTLALFRAVGDAHGTALALHGLGMVADFLGDYATARTSHEQALSLFRRFDDRLLVAVVLCYLGLAALHHGDDQAAAASFAESLAIGQELGHKALIGLGLAGYGSIAGARQQPVRAAHLLGAVEALNEMIGFVPPLLQRADIARVQATVRAVLDETAFATAWSAGQAMTLEQAVELALAKTSDAQ